MVTPELAGRVSLLSNVFPRRLYNNARFLRTRRDESMLRPALGVLRSYHLSVHVVQYEQLVWHRLSNPPYLVQIWTIQRR
jgi:hypothetical protein